MLEMYQKTTSPNLDLIPSHIDLVAAIELVDRDKREYMLKKALDVVKSEYDYIIIDCAPSLGLITVMHLQQQILWLFLFSANILH
jgi:chromosome partitioning protein